MKTLFFTFFLAALLSSCVLAQAEYQENLILSDDYNIAKKTLEKAVAERDEATLRLGLKKGSLSIKKDVIQAVRNAYFQTFVPDLIAVLEEIQTSEKAETDEQKQIKRIIIPALMHLTGLRFQQQEEFSRDDTQKIIEESQQWYRANEAEIQQSLKAEMIERQKPNPILSKNYNVAKWALDKAVSENDKPTLRLGLNAFSLLIKRKVVQAIKQFDDKSFVPDLIEALDNNQGAMSGGSETEFMQRELNEEIISALKQLTGLEFSFLSDSSTIPCFSDCPSKDIQRVLKESREWWEANKKRV